MQQALAYMGVIHRAFKFLKVYIFLIILKKDYEHHPFSSLTYKSTFRYVQEMIKLKLQMRQCTIAPLFGTVFFIYDIIRRYSESSIL